MCEDLSSSYFYLQSDTKKTSKSKSCNHKIYAYIMLLFSGFNIKQANPTYVQLLISKTYLNLKQVKVDNLSRVQDVTCANCVFSKAKRKNTCLKSPAPTMTFTCKATTLVSNNKENTQTDGQVGSAKCGRYVARQQTSAFSDVLPQSTSVIYIVHHFLNILLFKRKFCLLFPSFIQLSEGK